MADYNSSSSAVQPSNESSTSTVLVELQRDNKEIWNKLASFEQVLDNMKTGFELQYSNFWKKIGQLETMGNDLRTLIEQHIEANDGSGNGQGDLPSLSAENENLDNFIGTSHGQQGETYPSSHPTIESIDSDLVKVDLDIGNEDDEHDTAKTQDPLADFVNLDFHFDYVGKNEQESEQTTLGGDNTNSNSGVNVDSSGPERLACPSCSKSYRRPEDLVRHQHLHFPNLNPNRCAVCDKYFDRAKRLNLHMARHHPGKTRTKATKSTQKNCSICSNICHTEQDLLYHYEIQHASIPRNCTCKICGITASFHNRVLKCPDIYFSDGHIGHFSNVSGHFGGHIGHLT